MNNSESANDKDTGLPPEHSLYEPDAGRHCQQRHPVQRVDHRHHFTHLRVIVPQAQMAAQQGFDTEHDRFRY